MNLQRQTYFSVSSVGVPIRNTADYSPFGVQLDGRTIQGDFYRRGFNGMEKDDEVKGGGNSYTTEFRQYDARVGRWLSLDPLMAKFPWQSPYCGLDSNPISKVDPLGNESEGKGGGDDPIGPGYYQASVNSRMFAFSLRHPVAALSIGLPSSGSTNISTNSVRFSTRIGLNENQQHEGSQVNAFRHVLWQAEITKEFGTSIAKQVGNLHEENAFAVNDSNLKTSFKTLAKADEYIDLLNNKIGRSIGKENPQDGMQELAMKTLDYYKTKGLWVATSVLNDKGKVTGYNISQTKLSEKQYNEAKEIIKGLNDKGFEPIEQKKRDTDAQKKIDRLNQGPKY